MGIIGYQEKMKCDNAQNVKRYGGIKMKHYIEYDVRQKLIDDGFKVIRYTGLGYPDFLCIKGGNRFFIEVKSNTDSLRIRQIFKMANLIKKGFKIYLFIENKQGQIEKFKLNLNINQVENIEQNNSLKHITKKIIETEDYLTTLHEIYPNSRQLDYMLKVHNQGKSHKKIIKSKSSKMIVKGTVL